MEITVGEAADALSVSPDSIVRWYVQDRDAKAPRYFGLETEVLCENIGLDHRFLMAFLVGYDIALRNREVQVLLGRSRRWVPTNMVPVLTVPSVSLRKAPLVRYSYRRVVPICLSTWRNRMSSEAKSVALPVLAAALFATPRTISRIINSSSAARSLQKASVSLGAAALALQMDEKVLSDYLTEYLAGRDGALNVDTAMLALEMKERTLFRKVKDGSIPTLVHVGRFLRFSRAAIANLKQS